MTFSQSDLPHIKWSLLTFLLALSLTVGGVWSSTRFIVQAQLEEKIAQQQLTEARKQIDTARSDQENMNVYMQEYSLLLKQKIIGDDQRLDWMEGLSKLHQQEHVLDFKYTIAPQQPYTPAPALESGNYQLNLSNMTLQIDLLHENQLIQFLDSLRRNMNGWFILERCSLERTVASNNINPDSASTTTTVPAQLKAECTGGWLTLKTKEAK